MYELFDNLPFEIIRKRGTTKVDFNVLDLLRFDGAKSGYKTFFDALHAVNFVSDHPRNDRDMLFCMHFFKTNLPDALSVVMCTTVRPEFMKLVIRNFGRIEVPKLLLQRAQKLKEIHAITYPKVHNVMLWRYRLWNGMSHANSLSVILAVTPGDSALINSYTDALTTETQHRMDRRDFAGKSRVLFRMLSHLMTTLMAVQPELSFSKELYNNIAMLEIMLQPVPNVCRYCGKPFGPQCKTEDKEYKELKRRFEHFRVCA